MYFIKIHNLSLYLTISTGHLKKRLKLHIFTTCICIFYKIYLSSTCDLAFFYSICSLQLTISWSTRTHWCININNNVWFVQMVNVYFLFWCRTFTDDAWLALDCTINPCKWDETGKDLGWSVWGNAQEPIYPCVSIVIFDQPNMMKWKSVPCSTPLRPLCYGMRTI